MLIAFTVLIVGIPLLCVAWVLWWLLAGGLTRPSQRTRPVFGRSSRVRRGAWPSV